MQKRQTQSKQKIKAALLTLLLEKDFDKISVADITRVAGVNRGTFYQHYLDKFDLIEQLQHQFKEDLLALLTRSDLDESQALQAALHYFKDNRDFIQILMRSKAADLRNEVERFLTELLSRNEAFRSQIEATLHFPTTYASAAFFGSITSLVLHWTVNRDFQESPEALSQMMITLRQLYSGHDL